MRETASEKVACSNVNPSTSDGAALPFSIRNIDRLLAPGRKKVRDAPSVDLIRTVLAWMTTFSAYVPGETTTKSKSLAA